MKTDKTKNTYTFNNNKYLYFKLNLSELENFESESIALYKNIENIINILNANKEMLKQGEKSAEFNNNNILIKLPIYQILLSTYFYKKYINVVIYTLVQIVNNTSFNYSNIYDNYTKFEQGLIKQYIKIQIYIKYLKINCIQTIY